MKYCIVSSEPSLGNNKTEWKMREELERKVNEKINEGWKPIGGVTMAIGNIGFNEYYYYAQAMIKEK